VLSVANAITVIQRIAHVHRLTVSMGRGMEPRGGGAAALPEGRRTP